MLLIVNDIKLSVKSYLNILIFSYYQINFKIKFLWKGYFHTVINAFVNDILKHQGLRHSKNVILKFSTRLR